MAPQLQINQGPQDALLYDNSKSYFTNVGYTRTSNFQMELRDVDAQNTANLGATVNFVIPKAADLLGPCDLVVEFNKIDSSLNPGTKKFWGWVESVGHAMIEKITFAVGSHDVEVLTGEQLNIINELMRDDDHRYAFAHTLKTGRPFIRGEATGDGSSPAMNYLGGGNVDAYDYDRLIAYDSTQKDGKKLIVPLGLFFTKHPSAYFPLAAIAGVNDVRISIKFRTPAEILMGHGTPTVTGGANLGVITNSAAPADAGLSNCKWTNGAFKTCKLRCHYVHVTAPEHDALVNKEHVRLMSMWHGNEVVATKSLTASPAPGKAHTWDIDLSFLHPVKEMVIVIRKVNEMGSSLTTTGTWAAANTDHGAQTKNYFAYHGGGYDPNIENWTNGAMEQESTNTLVAPIILKTNSLKLTLNGQSRHLDGAGIDRDYLMNRLMPMLHSNTCDRYRPLVDSSAEGGNTNTTRVGHDDMRALGQLMDRKEIYVYPFSLNPEGANPSGAVNFSKVSHAKLSINLNAIGASGADEFQCNVYGIYYNWLAIKDGRALTSFA